MYSSDYSTSLLPTIRKYIELRRELNTQNGRLVNGSLQAQATPEGVSLSIFFVFI